MAPYDFQAPGADVILRSSDREEFPVHKDILSIASPVFRDMFNLPQPPEPTSRIPIVDLSEPSDILRPFIQFVYPRSPPNISDITTLAALFTIADKYATEVVTGQLRGMLIPRFLYASPPRVYALASHWGFEEEAKVASRRCLEMDISKGFSEEDASLMGGVACQKFYLLHIQRRSKAQALLNSHPRPLKSHRDCLCNRMDFDVVTQVLSQQVSTRSWLSAEDFYREFTGAAGHCGNDGCRCSFEKVHSWISSILKDLNELPQTI